MEIFSNKIDWLFINKALQAYGKAGPRTGKLAVDKLFKTTVLKLAAKIQWQSEETQYRAGTTCVNLDDVEVEVIGHILSEVTHECDSLLRDQKNPMVFNALQEMRDIARKTGLQLHDEYMKLTRQAEEAQDDGVD